METLRYVLLANGLLVVVSVAFYLLLRRETFFQINRLMLWLGILSVLILPALQFPDWRPQRVRFAMQHTAQVIAPNVLPPTPTRPTVTIKLPNGRSYPVTPIDRLARFGWSWQLALIGIYVVGLLLLAGRFALQLLSIWRLVRRSDREKFDAFTLVKNLSVSAPFSFLRWVVLNPARHTGDELDQILRHERVHIRQRHSLDMIMAEGIRIVFWLNPAAYLFRRLVHQTLEFCADQAVLAEGVDARTYQYNLLRVSMASGSLPITNSFSASQLHDRIRMINRQRSRWSQALKYPVFVVLSLTIVTAFARHKAEQLAAPVAQSLKTLLHTTPVETKESQPLKPTSLPNASKKKALIDTSIRPVVPFILNSSADSVAPVPYPERHSNSRLVTYKNDILYWIITPKTTLEDLNELGRELAKHTIKLRIRQIKYDPSYSFIDQLDVSVNDGSTSTIIEDIDNDNGRPLKTVGGYCAIGTWKEKRKIHSPSEPVRIPESLRIVAREDEAAIYNLINMPGKEAAISLGKSKFSQLGSGSNRYDQAYFNNKSTKGSGIIVKSDKSLAVDDDSKAATIYINNEPVAINAVELWTVDRLYAVVKRTRYDSTDKRIKTVGLLLYTIDK